MDQLSRAPGAIPASLQELSIILTRCAEFSRCLTGLPTAEAGRQLGSAQVAMNQPLYMARQIYRARRDRDRFFPDLMADPAWDLLLDLFIAGEEDRSVSVSSACIAAAVPPTTALRWINVLEKQGLIARKDDPQDGRKAYLSLSLSARANITEWLQRFSKAVRT